MPKTLAALPKSQYATDLELASGKNFLLAVLSALPIDWLKDASGGATPTESEPPCENGAVLL
jgi:hypothetical protein